MHPTSIADTQSAIFVLQRHSFDLPCLADSEHAGLQISKKQKKQKKQTSKVVYCGHKKMKATKNRLGIS